jgi:hypothetical protein
MKKNKFFVFLIVVILLLFSNCDSRNSNFEEMFENERINLETSIRKILSSLELNDFDIIIHHHKNVSNRIVSKVMSDTNWHGTGLNPELSNVSEVAYRDMSYGSMRLRTLTANYDLSAKNEIINQHFSIIIIVENINQRQTNELIRILDTHLINNERGDTVFIISKEEFNNLR